MLPLCIFTLERLQKRYTWLVLRSCNFFVLFDLLQFIWLLNSDCFFKFKFCFVYKNIYFVDFGNIPENRRMRVRASPFGILRSARYLLLSYFFLETFWTKYYSLTYSYLLLEQTARRYNEYYF